MSNAKRYTLSGGAQCIVVNPYKAKFYTAVVEIDGTYPEKGKFARNKGRQEHLLVLNGACECNKDGKVHHLREGEELHIEDGDTYTIIGKATVLVTVKDSSNAQTQII